VVTPAMVAPSLVRIPSFNPSVGILGGHTATPVCRRQDVATVSIPQSGFLVVTPDGIDPRLSIFASFNPSVGILGGHTTKVHR
jgi:hypothetical protein